MCFCFYFTRKADYPRATGKKIAHRRSLEETQSFRKSMGRVVTKESQYFHFLFVIGMTKNKIRHCSEFTSEKEGAAVLASSYIRKVAEI